MQWHHIWVVAFFRQCHKLHWRPRRHRVQQTPHRQLLCLKMAHCTVQMVEMSSSSQWIKVHLYLISQGMYQTQFIWKSITISNSPFWNWQFRFNPEEFPIEDCDKKARLQRALEIAEGVEPPPGFMSSSSQKPNATQQSHSSTVALTLSDADASANVATEAASVTPAEQHWHIMQCTNNAALRLMLPNLLQHPEDIPRIHSQVWRRPFLLRWCRFIY